MVGLVGWYDPESYEYAGGSVATGIASHARQIEGDHPGEENKNLDFQVGCWASGYQPRPLRSLNCWEVLNDCSLKETYKMTYQNQGFTSGNPECAVPIQKLGTSIDYSTSRYTCSQIRWILLKQIWRQWALELETKVTRSRPRTSNRNRDQGSS